MQLKLVAWLQNHNRLEQNTVLSHELMNMAYKGILYLRCIHLAMCLT